MGNKTKMYWCTKQPKGIKLVNPSEEISQEYIQRADEDLTAMDKNEGTWKIVTEGLK